MRCNDAAVGRERAPAYRRWPDAKQAVQRFDIQDDTDLALQGSIEQYDDTKNPVNRIPIRDLRRTQLQPVHKHLDVVTVLQVLARGG